MKILLGAVKKLPCQNTRQRAIFSIEQYQEPPTCPKSGCWDILCSSKRPRCPLKRRISCRKDRRQPRKSTVKRFSRNAIQNQIENHREDHPVVEELLGRPPNPGWPATKFITSMNFRGSCEQTRLPGPANSRHLMPHRDGGSIGAPNRHNFTEIGGQKSSRAHGALQGKTARFPNWLGFARCACVL